MTARSPVLLMVMEIAAAARWQEAGLRNDG